MGASFSVNITSIALRTALANEAAIEVVDPQPIDLGCERISLDDGFGICFRQSGMMCCLRARNRFRFFLGCQVWCLIVSLA